MKIIGIIIEANPLHHGHEHLINTVKQEHNPDCLIAVVSTYFTMRGDINCVTKKEKINQLLNSGFDLVFELPIALSMHRSDIFAENSVKILKTIGITHLAFGSEIQNIDLFNRLLAVRELPEYQELFKYYLNANSSYKHVVPADGGWLEFRWEDLGKNFGRQGGLTSNRPSLQTNGTSGYYPSEWLDKVDGFTISFKEIGAGKIYYIGDVQLLKPFKVKIEGEVVGSGEKGETVTLPEAPDGVIAYSDGKNLYYPGDEYTITGDVDLINITTIVDSSSDHDFVFDTEAKTYTGSEICPAVTSATLTEGEDYTVDYENNVKAGTATIYIRGTGSCYIDLSADFTISKKELETSDFSIAADGLTYSGEALTPTVSSDVFAEDDFTVVYHNNVNAGENAYAIVEGAGKNGYGAIEIPFTILPKEIEEDMFTFDLENKIYNKGIEICPEVTSETLTFSSDYSVGYSTNRDVGTASLYVKGIGNYCGRIDKNFEIVPKEITDADFTVDTDEKVYTASEICPEVTSTLGENDYEVTYENNVDTGVATIAVTGTGNYAGTLIYEFVILQKETLPEDFTIDLDAKDYTGKEIKPSVTSDILQDKDYMVSYENNVNVGTATITVVGLGNLKGEFTKEFTINKKTLTAFDFTIDLSDKEYENKEITPEVTSTFEKGVDYTVEYENNLNVGSAKITISACGDNCQGEFALEFVIVQHELTPEDFTVEDGQFVFSGEEFAPTVTSYLADDDYTVEYNNNINAGTAYITITGKDDCKGEATLDFTIEQKEIQQDWFSLEETSVVFDGIEQQVAVVSDLEEDVDYEVSYKDNLDVGTATVTVKGIGNYKGEVTLTFEITPKEVEKDYFTVDTSDKVYTGDEFTPEVASELEKDVDYTVEYADNVNVGTAVVKVTGKGNYKGTVEYNFAITPKALLEDDFTVDVEDKDFTGKAQELIVTSKLVKETDYTVAYANNVNAGEATVTIKGIGNYKDEIVKTFKIIAKTLNSADFALEDAVNTYNGSEFKPEVKSNLKKDVDYTVEYENNVNAGTAVVYIKGIGNYKGETFLEFKIDRKTIGESDFTVDTSAKEYTGSAITPEVKSNLVLNKDYTVVYTNNKAVGQATIQVMGIGNYAGSLLKSFIIVEKLQPGNPTNPNTPAGDCKHTSIVVSGKVNATYFATGYTGDKKCAACGGFISQGTTIKKLKLVKPKFSVKAVKGKKQFKVTYKKVKGANRFQVRYKVKGKWKVKTFKAKKNATKLIKKLKAGKYKVQVRAMIKQGKLKAYSKWASAKKVTVK